MEKKGFKAFSEAGGHYPVLFTSELRPQAYLHNQVSASLGSKQRNRYYFSIGMKYKVHFLMGKQHNEEQGG